MTTAPMSPGALDVLARIVSGPWPVRGDADVLSELIDAGCVRVFRHSDLGPVHIITCGGHEALHQDKMRRQAQTAAPSLSGGRAP